MFSSFKFHFSICWTANHSLGIRIIISIYPETYVAIWQIFFFQFFKNKIRFWQLLIIGIELTRCFHEKRFLNFHEKFYVSVLIHIFRQKKYLSRRTRQFDEFSFSKIQIFKNRFWREVLTDSIDKFENWTWSEIRSNF